MRTSIQLLRIALGKPEFQYDGLTEPGDSAYFDVYRVQLPMPEFRGFPPKWTFAILRRPGDGAAAPNGQVIEGARKLLAKIPPDELIVMISDDPDVHLGDEFTPIQRNVFCLDHDDLPRHARESKPNLAPFVQAFRRKLPTSANLELLYTPYVREKPVTGWKFFGREQELQDIVYGDENIVIVGARRVGKSSLMQEAVQRIRERGDHAYWVDLQPFETASDAIDEILRRLSARDAVAAFRDKNVIYRQAELMHESPLSVALSRLTTSDRRTSVFLDEIGQPIRKQTPEDWEFLGNLRRYSQKGRLRLIVSIFPITFFHHQGVLNSPLVNFGTTMRLGIFSEEEGRQFVLSPIEFWKPLGEEEKLELIKTIATHIGFHPYLLQYYCHALFRSLLRKDGRSLLNKADSLSRKELIHCFESAVEEVFYHNTGVTLKYLFLRRCAEAEAVGDPLTQTEIDDDWLEATLTGLGYSSTLDVRRNLLEGLETHGLCTAADHKRRRQIIAAPVIYHYVKEAEDSIPKFLRKLEGDIRKEGRFWGLEPL